MNNKEVLVALRDGLNSIAQMITEMLEIDAKDKEETWVTCKQASRATGVSIRTIQYWAYNGKVNCQRDGKTYLVSLEDLKRKIQFA